MIFGLRYALSLDHLLHVPCRTHLILLDTAKTGIVELLWRCKTALEAYSLDFLSALRAQGARYLQATTSSTRLVRHFQLGCTLLL